jgi:hypothetical protein
VYNYYLLIKNLNYKNIKTKKQISGTYRKKLIKHDEILPQIFDLKKGK